METSRSSDATRAGAVWVTATGSFLLFAAAVAFVAVRWDQIPDGVKLGALAVLSGGLLLAGRQDTTVLARRAPAAANVLYHLGSFLAPVTVAALLVHLEVPQASLLLVLGAGTAILFTVLGRAEDSVVLAWGSAVAVGVAAVGLGGLTPVPATGWLVVASVLALAAGYNAPATAWATAAALVPLALLAADGRLDRPATADLVTAVTGTGLTPAVAGMAATAVLLVLTHRSKSSALLVVAGTGLVSGVVTASEQLDPSPATTVVALGATFLLAELAALFTRRDPFWAPPLHVTAIVSETASLWLLVVALFSVALLPVGGLVTSPPTAVALGLAAVAWLVGDLRRAEGQNDAPALDLLVGGNWWPGTTAATLSALGAIASGTGSAPLTAVVALAVAALLVVSGRSAALVLVPTLAVLAPIVAVASPWVSAAAGAAGALLVAGQAVLHRRYEADLLAAACLVPAILAGIALETQVDRLPLVLGALALAAGLAAVLDRARSGDDLGLLPRVAGSVAVLAMLGQPAEQVAIAAAAYLALVLAETFRRDDPQLLWGFALGLPLAVGAIAAGFGLDPAAIGLPMTLAAVPFAAAAVRWPVTRLPMAGTALTLTVAGFVAASGDPAVLGTVLLLDGVVALAAGLALERVGLLSLGGGAAVVGVWIHLSTARIESVDLYALPVAALLWLVGTQVADRNAPSWVTHGPAVALAGGTALAERLGGGGGGHAVLAGAIALLAVVEGGGRRLAAPLFLGTGLLVALTVHETTAVTAGVPTWAWLATGGALLVIAGLAMEHHELSPVETGRRLVDVVQDRFR